MKKYKKHIFIICVLGVFITILIYNALTPYLSDDIIYKDNVKEARNVFDLVRQQYQEYLSNSGRIIGQFNIRLSLVFDKYIFNIVNSIMFVLLSLLIYWNIQGRKGYDSSLYLLIVFAIWRYSVNFGETILWLCGACNYLWGSVIILGFVTLYRKILKKKQIKRKILTAFFMFLYGLIAGWCNENTSGGGFLLILMFTISAYINQKKEKNVKIREYIQPYIITSHLGMLCGLMGIVLSPGAHKRAAVQSGIENYDGLTGYLSRLYKCFVEIDRLFLELIIILGCIIIALVVCNRKIKIILEDISPFVVASAATAFVLVLIPTPMNRAYFGAGIFLIIACVQSFFYLCKGVTNKRELYLGYYCALWILAISFFFVYVENLVNLARIYREDKERIALIERAVDEGENRVVIPQYREEFRNTFSNAHDSDMQEDPGYWINQYYEGYYEIECITAIPRDLWNEKFG